MDQAMKHPVVVGVDGSGSALRAVRWAAAAAQRRGASLRLVHAYETPVGYPAVIVDPKAVRDAMRTQSWRWLREARDVATETVPDLRTDIVSELAPVVPALVKESRDATLVVLGTRGLGGFTGLLVGSTAVTLAGRAHCPMVVVRGPSEDEPAPTTGSVVVGVDGTPTSEAAIAFAFAEASLRGCDLVAVHTWADSLVETAWVGGAAALDFVPLQQQAYETLAERLAGWQEKYPDVHLTREVVQDHPARALLRYAHAAQLVVVGTRGRGGFRGLVLGSTGHRLLHHAPCPVAVVRTDTDSLGEGRG